MLLNIRHVRDPITLHSVPSEHVLTLNAQNLHDETPSISWGVGECILLEGQSQSDAPWTVVRVDHLKKELEIELQSSDQV